MTIRPKTKRRIIFLGLIAALILVAGFGLYRFRMHQADLKIVEVKTEGMAAFNAGDYPTAIEKLSIYVTKRKSDTEALMAFAIARSKVPTLDGSYIVQAVAIARRYCDLQPGNVEAQHFLLELEAPLNLYAAAALDQAHDLLQGNPADLVALKAIAQIQTRARKFDEALDATEKYCDANPTDLEMQQRALYLLQAMGREPGEIHQRADDLQKKYPNDPRFLIVQAMACIYAKGPAETTDERTAELQNAGKLLQQAAAADPPDSQFVNMTTHLLDSTGQYAASLEVLTRAAEKLKDPALTPALAQRLWQNHEYDQAVALLADITPANAWSDKTNADVVAYKALSLYSLNKKSDADALAAALAKRDNEPSAVAWTLVLQTEYGDANSSLKERLDQLQEAMQHAPNNPVVAFLLGETYLRMGENSLALQEWQTASARAPSWAQPQVRVAEMLATEGHEGPDANIAAQRAKLAGVKGQGSYQVEVITAQILVAYSNWQTSHDPQAAQDLITAIESLQRQIPNEPETLAVYVDLLAQTGDRDKAIAAIRGAEAQAGQVREDTLLRLAKISKQSQLKMESEIYATIQKQFGLTPRLALAEAFDLFNAGQSAQGLQLVQSGKDKGVGTPVQWDLVVCQYRESSGDPAAPAAWQALGDAHPDDLLVQSTILADENSAWTNRAFIDRTIGRLRDMTGDDAIGWKVYRARWLIEGDDSQRDASAAVVLLTDVLKLTSKDDVGPHVLMALANEKLQNYPAAITEWRQAADLAPDSGKVLWGLLRCLDADAQPDEARLAFDRLANVSKLSPDVALEASLVIAREGDMERAQRLLTAYPTCSNQTLHDATLAKVDRVLGQINDAATYYFKLAQAPSLDAGTIREAADFFASQHDIAAARKFLARLDETNLSPVQREMIVADFEDRYGDPAAAGHLYDDAARNSGEPDAAIAQIGYLIRRHDWASATTALNLAIAHWSDNEDLANLKTINQTYAGSPKLADLAPDVVSAVTRNPSDPAGTDTLAALAAEGTDLDQNAQAMSDLVQKYPRFFPAYELAVGALMADRRMDDAVTMAAEVMVQFPENPDAARISAQAYAAVGRWGDFILAATKWRQRGAEQPQQADIMISIADLFTDQASDAVERLAPYIPDAKGSPDVYEDVLVTYAEALIRAGNETDAAALLRPLAEKSARWRYDWLKIASFAHTDGTAAVAWIDQIRPLFDANSVDDQEKIADAYFDVAIHLNDSHAFALARDAVAPFVDSPNATTPLLMTYALSSSAAGDDAAAEHAYRQLLKNDPKQGVAQNNLADLLRKKDSPDALSEAEALARSAIATAPNDPDTSNFYDTLARTLLKEGRTDDAIAAFQQGEHLQPKNFSVLIGLASTYAHANRIDDASRYLNQIDSLMPPNMHLPPDSQAELDSARDLVKKANPPSTTP